MKLDNRFLTILFFALLGIFVFKKFIDKPKVRSFREVLVEIDTSQVNKIVLNKPASKAIVLLRKADKWLVKSGDREYEAMKASVDPILRTIAFVKASQLVSRSEDKWSEFELDETAGRKIEVYNGDKLKDAFWIGRFDFDQNRRTAQTYVRKADEADVYAVEGFLSMTFDKKVEDFRNKSLFENVSSGEVKSLSLQTEGEASLIFEKTLDGEWMAEQALIDSSAIVEYLGRLTNSQGAQFIEGLVPEQSDLLSNLIVELNDGRQSEVKIYRDETTEKFVVNSTDNPDAFFLTDSTALYKTLITDIRALSKL